jgi:NAD(P)-dependent dehydrogenase (short-subunit alcohol dehydrogenase family)
MAKVLVIGASRGIGLETVRAALRAGQAPILKSPARCRGVELVAVTLLNDCFYSSLVAEERYRVSPQPLNLTYRLRSSA